MSSDLQQAQSRLENIRKVKPILAALRTISLGSWQMARNRRAGLRAYAQRLLALLPLVVPSVVGQERAAPRWLRRLWPGSWPGAGEPAGLQPTVVLVIGSERGLIGRYNAGLVARLGEVLDERHAGAEDVTLMALGSRLTRELQLAGYAPDWRRPLSVTSLPSYGLAQELMARWLEMYEAYEIAGVDVIYNADRGAGTYGPAVVRLLPPELPAEALDRAAGGADGAAETWSPPVLMATDPVQLYVRVVEQWTAVEMYRLLLEAAVTEHSARYQLMESATQNADRIVDELTLTVQSARRQAITRQMLELAVGAGLLDDDGSPQT